MEALLPFIMAGDGRAGLDGLPDLLARFAALGVTTLELGVPHSDPVADGPVLQAAAQRAMLAGASLGRLLEVLAGVRSSPELVLFTYYNPIRALGPRLLERLRPTPVKALLVVDLPVTEEPEWEAGLAQAGYPLVPLLSPTTSLARAAAILAARPDPGAAAGFAQRFAYLVARLGVTGSGPTSDLGAVQDRIRQLRTLTERPLAVGFGLDDPALLDQVRAMGATPVIGSALVRALHEGHDLEGFLSARGVAPVG